MSVNIRGMGWVTPMGVGLDEVWDRISAGEIAATSEVKQGELTHRYFAVPSHLTKSLERNPRLRRSSAITYFTAAAGLAALENAGLSMTPEIARRTAIVFAIASGGVIYTRKFYDGIVKQGAGSASPLLFPETVYNAPASHLAALLGVEGMTYTVVGDGSIGISAVQIGSQLLESGQVDFCLVVGGEEIDWVLCAAYREWRLLTSKPQIELYANLGTLLGEGAAALLLARDGGTAISAIHGGVLFDARKKASAAIAKVHRELRGEKPVDAVVSCANGTFIDRAERLAIESNSPGARLMHPKVFIGEALGASALMQTICGALWLGREENLERVLVSSLGWNQQANGLTLERSA
jgi:3-oxoacyl-(acyl-carrier-protein) synthase